MDNPLVTVLVLGVAIGAVSFTLARTKVTESLRSRIDRRSTWFGTLVNCNYCLSHWISFAAVAIYRPVLTEVWYPLDLLVSAMVMVAISAFTGGLIRRSLT